VEHAVTALQGSERRACRAIGQVRSAYRDRPRPDPNREQLRERIIALAKEYGRYGYRTVTGMVQREGWDVGKDGVYTIWRQEGLNVPQKQPKRARLWRADGSWVRLRPAYRNHVWAYDFVAERTHDGRPFRILNILDEYTRECLASVVARRIRSQDVLLVLAELFVKHGLPAYIRSDNGPEFVARNLRTWLKHRLGVEPLFIEPGSPWENGYCESFNGKMRDQLLNGELFYTLQEAQIIIERWRQHYNTVRPHSSLGGQPPAPEAIRLAS
jgi:transposase InsO family protein